VQLVSFERAPRFPRASASMGAAGLGFETLDGVAPGARRLGALLANGAHAGSVVDLNRALAVRLAADDAGAPEAEADSLLPADALAFLRRLPGALDTARDVVAWVERALERYDAPDLVAAGVVTPRRDVRLAAPVPRPGKIVAVDFGAACRDAQARPSLLLEAPSAVAGPEDALALPALPLRLGFSLGLAAVIGRVARAVPAERALECVAGYCVAIDCCAEGDGASSDPLARSGDGSTLLGPALVTVDEVGDPQDLGVRASISREPRRSGRTREMHFSVAELLAFASERVTFEPGDVLVASGVPGVSPAGPASLRDGDVIEVEIERLGKLVGYVRAAASGV
jgi:2-keto-4-pentenoate hydratase/2-oxohepta-3-ene-1,7-dioic acid hydratase in catechol pathway